MDCITLAAFRENLYGCFLQAGDTLLNLIDAKVSRLSRPAQFLRTNP